MRLFENMFFAGLWGFLILGCFCAYQNEKKVDVEAVVKPSFRSTVILRLPSKEAPLPTTEKTIQT